MVFDSEEEKEKYDENIRKEEIRGMNDIELNEMIKNIIMKNYNMKDNLIKMIQ